MIQRLVIIVPTVPERAQVRADAACARSEMRVRSASSAALPLGRNHRCNSPNFSLHGFYASGAPA